MVSIRKAEDRDQAAIWRILEPIVREGSTYALASDLSERDALRYWHAPGHEVHQNAEAVAEAEDHRRHPDHHRVDAEGVTDAGAHPGHDALVTGTVQLHWSMMASHLGFHLR